MPVGRRTVGGRGSNGASVRRRAGIAGAVLGLAALAAPVPAASAVSALSTASPGALSATCRSLQAKAIAAEAVDAAGDGTVEQVQYLRRCPSADPVVVYSLGTLVRFRTVVDGRGIERPVRRVTSSVPKVVAVGRPVQAAGGRQVAAQMVSLGRSRVCVTASTGFVRCQLAIVPKALSGKAGGRTLNVAFGNQAGDAARVVSATSADPTIVTVATDAATSLPYVVLGTPGSTMVCARYTKGAGGCQRWTIVG